MALRAAQPRTGVGLTARRSWRWEACLSPPARVYAVSTPKGHLAPQQCVALVGTPPSLRPTFPLSLVPALTAISATHPDVWLLALRP